MPRVLKWLQQRWLVLAGLILYLPMTFFGYGSDVDTFRVLDSGRNFLATADYVPSRRPGFLVHELATFALDQLGGSWLANLGTLFWAVAGLVSFRRICRRYQVPHADLLSLILLVHPLFWFNATVTIDYLWALGMLLVGFDLLGQERFGWAGLALGLAAGCRITTLLAVGPLLIFSWVIWPRRRRALLISALLAGALAAAALILPWDFAEWRPSFWAASVGSADLWSMPMQLGRFVYKNIYFWGLPAALLLAGLALISIRAWLRPAARPLALTCLAVLVLYQALFVRYPIEAEYLLPTLPFWLILLGLGVRRRGLLAALLVLVLAYNLASFNLARPDVPSQARQARYGLWLEPGYLLRETSARLDLLGCRTHACYDERISSRP